MKFIFLRMLGRHVEIPKRSERKREKAKLEKAALQREKIPKEKEKQKRKKQTELKRRQQFEKIRKRREETERLLTSPKISKKMTRNTKYPEKKKVELNFLARQVKNALRRRKYWLMKETVKKITYKQRRQYPTPKIPSFFSTNARAKRNRIYTTPTDIVYKLQVIHFILTL